ncbi:MAG: hypothetical protein EOO26_06245 [Comamonadaceae bacterium]|nr:MAG: hypothetical protein EOO26_06245 [Comamonadaceae bacterium]
MSNLQTPSSRSPRAYRTWPASLLIAAALAAYIGGLVAWDRATPGTRLLPVGATVSVGHARFVPAAGWEMDVGRSRVGQSIVLFKEGYTFAVKSGRWLGDQAGPIERQQRFMERVERVRIDGEVAGFFNMWGLAGTTFAYYGPTTVGRFWQIVNASRQAVVQVDCYGPPEHDADALAEARDMIDSMDLDAAGS